MVCTDGFRPFLYWTTIVATTTVGTTLADFVDRSLGIGYAGGSALLLSLVLGSLAVWYATLKSVEVTTVSSPKAEVFYWVTIMFSQTLGTALGDWTADSAGLGYGGAALVFSGPGRRRPELGRIAAGRQIALSLEGDAAFASSVYHG